MILRTGRVVLVVGNQSAIKPAVAQVKAAGIGEEVVDGRAPAVVWPATHQMDGGRGDVGVGAGLEMDLDVLEEGNIDGPGPIDPTGLGRSVGRVVAVGF